MRRAWPGWREGKRERTMRVGGSTHRRKSIWEEGHSMAGKVLGVTRSRRTFLTVTRIRSLGLFSAQCKVLGIFCFVLFVNKCFIWGRVSYVQGGCKDSPERSQMPHLQLPLLVSYINIVHSSLLGNQHRHVIIT